MNTERPTRPITFTLVVAVCLLLYVALPLLGVFYPLYIANRVLPEKFPDAVELGGTGEFMDTGAELGGAGVFQIAFSLVFALILILAWLGRPPRIRRAVVGAVLFQIIVVMVNAVQIRSGRPPVTSAEHITYNAQPTMVLGAVLVGAFVIWYFNRAPAEAFFTGKPIVYIEDEEE